MTTKENAHYYIKDILFLIYMDAIDYCDQHNIKYIEIKKTKKYI